VTGIESIADFNKYIADLCNVLWRQRLADERTHAPSWLLDMPPYVSVSLCVVAGAARADVGGDGCRRLVQLCVNDADAPRALSLTHAPSLVAFARTYLQVRRER
jgi:hypothetical protein